MFVSESFPVAAALSDVLMNAHLVADAARGSGTAAPLMIATEALFEETAAQGHGALDMAAVVHAIAARDTDRPAGGSAYWSVGLSRLIA